MKKFLVILLAFALTACTTQTEYGQCVGAGEKERQDLEYKPSTMNVILSILFIETVIVPVIVLLDEFKCPIAKKQSTSQPSQ